VTVAACNSSVFASQRVCGAAVIEIRKNRTSRHAPACSVVALLACASKPSFMGIHVAVRTLTESKSLETNRRSLLVRRVTTLAGNASVKPRECKARLRMIELRHRLPRRRRVAALALRAELSLMLILVARHAVGLQREKTFRCVTLSAGE
jgi:hypothetical protein